MKGKRAIRSRRPRSGTKRADIRKAATVRLDARLQTALASISDVRKVPVSRLVNEAVSEYLERHAATVEADLEATLRRVRAYRQADPDFEAEISKVADAEARFGIADPAEGRTTRAKRRGRTVSEAVLEDRR